MTRILYNQNLPLPRALDLPDSDDTPVDNELQIYIPDLADDILSHIWAHRNDWFWGMDMGIYYHPEKPPIVPDGFLSLGVQRIKNAELRPSYVVWEEDGIVPILVLEVVSETYGGEYDKKKQDYAELGVLYYIVYNPLCRPHRPRRGRKGRYEDHQTLEVYRLESGEYQLINENPPIWLAEIGLGIGAEMGTYRGRTREWLYWYDENGERYLTSEELRAQERQRAETERQRAEAEQQRAETERQRAEQEQQRADRLAEYLRSQGIDPDHLP